MRKKKTMTRWLLNNVIILVVFGLALVLCTVILQEILWDNTNEMGISLVKNYSSAEEQSMKTCQTALNMSVDYLQACESEGASEEETRMGLTPIMKGLANEYGEDKLQMYGKICHGSVFVSGSDDIKPNAEALTKKAWYQGAVKANGEVYISPIYEDAVTGMPVVTMCRLIPESGSFLAMDLKPRFFEDNSKDIELPEVATFFLIDRDGQLIYYRSTWGYEPEEFQALVDRYREIAECREQSHVSENVYGTDGIERNVYFYHLENGWTGILTIPKNQILSGSDRFRNICFTLVGAGLILILVQFIKEYKDEKRERQYVVYQKAMNSTARACRAIYYVDVDSGATDTVYPLDKDGKPRHSTYEREVSDRFKYGVVAEEHLELVRDFLDIENIKIRLQDRDHIELQFKRSNFDVNKRETLEGGYEWCSIAVTVAERVGEKLSAITISIRSIDDVIQREEEQRQMLALAVARAEAASQAKSDFLSRMSHDIRTPMNAILGMTAVAAIHIDEKNRVMDALDKITVSGKHLLGLINDVLDMSRIESGKVSLVEESFNLSDTIDNFLAVFRSQVDAKQLTLEVHIEKIQHESVIGDEQHLQQIFMNIMGNAVKFTPPGGRISIYIVEKPSYIPGSGCYEFAFEDTGVGMEQEYIKTIFDPFSRAANSTGNKIEGTGLGMSIAVNIARMMDGDIKVESELGKGSRFTVMVHLKLDDFVPENMDMLVSLPVLVVDDEQDACESACDILRSIGMDAEYVTDGDSAVRRVAEAEESREPFAVVILDWKMPGKDGLQTAREIREKIGDIPIIILSAYDWSEIESKAQEVGVDAFVSKPMFKSKLTRVLQNVLCKDRQEQESNAFDDFKKKNFSGRRVLLVEDNDINTEVAQELLRIVGIRSEAVVNGKLAVERLRDTEPGYFDLVFMDIQMPVMNGYEATGAIRAMDRPDLKTIPIIAMSADAFSDDIRRSKEVGMNDHVSKPINLERLEDILFTWLAAEEGKPSE